MIIPPRCFTCGTVIGDKWKPFVKNVLEEKEKSVKNIDTTLDIEYIRITDEGRIKKSIEGKVLDDLDLKKYCCRMMFLGIVHLITHI